MFSNLKKHLREIRVSCFLPCAIAAPVFIAAAGIIYSATGSDSHWIWVCTVLLFILLTFIYLSLIKHVPGTAEIIQNDSFLGHMNLNLIVKMPFPIIICNSSENIIWFNSAFSQILGKQNIIGLKFTSFSGISISEVENSNSESSSPVTFKGHVYTVRCYLISSKSKKYYVTLWEDKTKLENAIQTIKDEEIIVAYVMADNLEELSQYSKNSTREVANELENLLKAWVESSEGIMREYQSGRYICLFKNYKMSDIIEKKFDILDRIREIRFGENNLSVTVSMGISRVSGSLTDKERVAAEALDMALQRGGDQAVVKSPAGLEFFGGKTQTVQKRTKVRARVFANELASVMSKSTNVLIMGHRAPDFDCIGACIGIARLASFCGVRFNIICNYKDQNFIKCYNRIYNLDPYRSGTIFVNAAEAQELIGSETLTVIVDVNNKKQFEAPEVAEISKRTVYIDHHRKTAEFDEPPIISYIEPSASSACELVAEILEQSVPSGTLLKEEADIMYSGILLDTKQFTRNSGVKTFSAALYLRGQGANPADAQTLFKSCLEDFISEAKFESNVVIYRKILAISCNDDESNNPSDRIAAAKAADKLLTVEGVKASFALCRIGDKIHISARSSGEINVQLILEKLEGGGHFDAAATQLTSNMSEALTMLKNAIDEYFSENPE